MKKLLLFSAAALLAGCSGMRTNNGAFAAHAESIRLFGCAIPRDDMKRAQELVPAGAENITVSSTPADWTSVTGVIGNILWPHSTMVTGTLPKSAEPNPKS